MRVVIKYGSYNERRYGRPWIAKITEWPVGKAPTVEWGRYVGGCMGGEAEIEADPGDIIRSGQKDYRGRGTSNDWYVVDHDGIPTPIPSTKARILWDAKREKQETSEDNPLSVYDDEQLLAEVRRRGLTL